MNRFWEVIQTLPNGKTKWIETHENPKAAFRAALILAAHEIKNGRVGEYWVKPFVSYTLDEIDLPDWVKEIMNQTTKTKSIIRLNTEEDPNYCPYCGRCPGLVRMVKVEPFYWRCRCGAEHDEREKP